MPDKQTSEEINRYTLTDNVIKRGKTLGISNRNWIEAGIFSVINGWLITRINFVSNVKVVVLLITLAITIYVNLNGFKNRSITQIIIDEYKYRKSKCEYHLTPPNIARKGYKGSERNEKENISDVEKTIRFVKKYYTKICKAIKEEQ